ncbi:MAG: amidohydrolase family protein [Candidatus Hinthialibacter antarcticus]|nr:amidohydrolase family protein [Candidatus Hinthialibacter antarcticus]
MKRLLLCLCASFLLVQSTTFADEVTQYPDIPRIDVHTHITSDVEAIEKFHSLRKALKDTNKIDLALWLNLGGGSDAMENNDEAMAAGQGRMLCAISDYSSHDGLKYDPAELQQWLDRGYVGYKIWAGPAGRKLKPDEDGIRFVDNPALEPTFAKMEEIGMVGASIHIADPNGPWGARTKWLPDPVAYWKEILAWRNVLERHPNLVVVNAHGMWSLCQDAQIDYLRNTLSTFPNLHVDLAATFQYFNLVDRDNLRDFMIEYDDRILFGTDVGKWTEPEETEYNRQRFFQAFQILETDETIAGSFFGDQPTQGLNLPRETLEKIYYKNAARIYPRVKESLQALGYSVE